MFKICLFCFKLYLKINLSILVTIKSFQIPLLNRSNIGSSQICITCFFCSKAKIIEVVDPIKIENFFLIFC